MKDLGYFQLKLEQQQAISAFVEGQDVFVSEFVTYGVWEVTFFRHPSSKTCDTRLLFTVGTL